MEPSKAKLFDHYPSELIDEITQQMFNEKDYVTERDLELETKHKPNIAKACPVRVLGLEKGNSYLYCTCGHSKT